MKRYQTRRQSGNVMFYCIFWLAALAIGAMIVFNLFQLSKSNVSYGPAGVVETRCIEGFKFLLTTGSGRYTNTTLTQMRDRRGSPIECTEVEQ